MRVKTSCLNGLILGGDLLLCLGIYLVPQSMLKTVIHLIIFILCIGAYSWSQIMRHGDNRVGRRFYEVYLIGVLYILSILLFKNQVGAHVLYLISAPLFAVYLYENVFNLRILNIAFLLVTFYFLGSVAMGRDLEDVMASSRNYVSVIMMTSAAVLTAITYRQTGKIIIWPSLITTFLSILAIGRGGILFSALSLLGVLFCANEGFLKKHRVAAFLLFVVIVAAIVLNMGRLSDLYESLDVFERMRSRGLHDFWREHLMEEYLKNMNFKTVLFGYDFTLNPEFNFLENNPHNSFIRLHSLMGVLMVPLLACAAFVSYRFLKKDILFFFLFVPLLGRAYTDSVFFMTYHDYIVYYFILLGMQRGTSIRALHKGGTAFIRRKPKKPSVTSSCAA